MRYLKGHTSFVQAVAFSPDGRRLASGGSDGRVGVWRLTGGGEPEVLVPPTGREWVGALAFSPDGKRLCVGSHDGEVSLWDLGGDLGKLPPPPTWEEQGRITAVQFAPDGKALAWASYQGGAVCPLGRRSGPRAFQDGGSMVFALRIAPDGKSFATGGTGPEIYLRKLSDFDVLTQLTHADPQGCWSLAFAPRGRTLALALSGGLQLWDLASGRLLAHRRDHQDVVSGVAFSADGTRLLTCGWDQTARLYSFDPAQGEIIQPIATYDWKIGRLYDVALSPDGTLAAAAGNEGDYLVVWDVE